MSFIEQDGRRMVNTRSGREISRASPARIRRPLHSPPRGPGVVRVVTAGTMPPMPRAGEATNFEMALTFAAALALVVAAVGPTALIEGFTSDKDLGAEAAAAAAKAAWKWRPLWPFAV